MSSETREGKEAKGAQEMATAVAAAGLLAVFVSAAIWLLTPGQPLKCASITALASALTLGWAMLMFPGVAAPGRSLLGAGAALALLSTVVLNPRILIPVAVLPLLPISVFLLSWGLRSYEAARKWMHRSRRRPGAAAARSARPKLGGGAPPQASAAAEPAGSEEGEHDQTAVVYVTAGGRKYHRKGCRHLRSGAMAVSLEDARARRCTPCSVCASRE